MIQFGIDILLQQNPEWKQQRIALVTNHAATTNKLIPSRKALLDNGFNIIKLFSPEHGLDVKGADGKKIKNGFDELTNLPIISLYNKKLAPSKNDLKDIDIVLFDIPDIGCRCYTYLWTMTHVMESCAKHNKKLIVLDRPNPIGGYYKFIEGPLLDEEKCSSFIGRWNIPLRHSCTFGELALYFNETKNINADLEIIKCKKWNRSKIQTNWKIKFVPTSPAIKSFEAMLLYPGLVLLEATNISEGRGTNKSFTVAGAPWIDAEELSEVLNQFGFYAEPVQFTPETGKYKNEKCYGVQFIARKYYSVLNGLYLIRVIKDLYPKHFKWEPYPTNVNPSGANHLDKLLGFEGSEKLFTRTPNSFRTKSFNLVTKVSPWRTKIKKYLLY